ncbi:hypothetical protein KFL_000740320 [Klebsormidium nitens]|uniref:DNL-type domain-containing protein n=1 Tax=Klebsormidium nitens TaxID=105231 RepID=A0A1Y1HW74_KLENI|nr:hypothetical protein KFL_000740320 [Klebsormidium nitens]|eukprot:GAQ81231.1 hypothetical protein KFL_000740320 [Klebsormidium nitens]
MRHRTEETRWRACAAIPDIDPPPLQEEEVTLPDTDEVRETVAIKLPGRRSLQIQFTCNACGTRSTRLLNPFAFTRGTVFVQCAGCEKYHQLVDNLGLIKEYNLKEERENDALAASGQNEDTSSESM